MLKIGLTGGIGSGKSSVSKLFESWGAYIFDADKEAKIILNNNETAQSEIIAEFGTDVLGHNNEIDKYLVKWRKTENSLSSNTFQKLIDGFKVYNFYLNHKNHLE